MQIDWALVTSTFILIFVAELPDKTAFAALFLSTSHSPLAVFLGAAGAFLIQSAVAVALGSVAGLLPEGLVHGVSGALFLVFAVLMWRRQAEDEAKAVEPGSTRFLRSAGTAFLVIFIAEWGDLTQLATAALVAKVRAPLTIFVAATLALWAVTALGVIVGSRLKHALPAKPLQRFASVAMALVGIYLLATGW